MGSVELFAEKALAEAEAQKRRLYCMDIDNYPCTLLTRTLADTRWWFEAGEDA
jgi:hypothetical protein